MLILSAYAPSVQSITRATALVRNQLAAALAAECFFHSFRMAAR